MAARKFPSDTKYPRNKKIKDSPQRAQRTQRRIKMGRCKRQLVFLNE
jgi:hypothetical protein